MKALRYILLGLLVVIVLLVIVGSVVVLKVTRGPLPQQTGTLTVKGLTAPVEILRDSYGVPHIYATNTSDLFFAQGYTHAQDRWWQMEFARHVGAGRIQELTGGNENALSSDLFIRTIGWYRAAQYEYENTYDAETIAYLDAFANGVNAYISSRAPGDLAMEYSLLGVTGVNITVEPWTAVDSIVWGKVMMWDLSDQMEDFEFQEWSDGLTPEQYTELTPPYPFDTMPTIVTADDLPIGERAPLDIITTHARPAVASTVTLSPAAYQLAGNIAPGTRFMFGQGDGIGSNNWVVSGDLTTTGKPLLANDPHLSLQMPSIWYEIGLHCQPVSAECPYDVRGYSFVPSPGIVIGHNARIAWGFTNVGPDVMDLYSIKVNPDNPLQYEYDGEMLDMTVLDETIRVGDGDETYAIQIRQTVLGPIMNDNGVGDDGKPLGFNAEPVAIRWTAHDPTQLFTSLVKLNKAGNFEEFRDALSYFAGPSQNMIYADVDGNIGYQTPGLIPVRPAVNDGLRIQDGSTSATAWLGYIPFDLLPRIYNPERGWIHSANEALVVPEYYDQLAAELADEYGADINAVIGLNWDYGYRGLQITSMLEATDQHTRDTFKAIQGDNWVGIAEAVIPYYRDLALEDGSRLDQARDLLVAWDLQADADSPAAALWGATFFELINASFNDQLENADLPTVGSGSRTQWALTGLLDEPDNLWWDNQSTEDATVETRDETLTAALTRALAWGDAKFGTDLSKWSWGEMHQAVFVSNPLGASGIDLIENIVNRSAPVGGSTGTVNAANWRMTSFDMVSGASFRMIADLSDWDASENMNTTGQSGHPFSEHYADLIPLWSTLKYKPMLFGRAAVEAAAASRLMLQP